MSIFDILTFHISHHKIDMSIFSYNKDKKNSFFTYFGNKNSQMSNFFILTFDIWGRNMSEIDIFTSVTWFKR